MPRSLLFTPRRPRQRHRGRREGDGRRCRRATSDRAPPQVVDVAELTSDRRRPPHSSRRHGPTAVERHFVTVSQRPSEQHLTAPVSPRLGRHPCSASQSAITWRRPREESWWRAAMTTLLVVLAVGAGSYLMRSGPILRHRRAQPPPWVDRAALLAATSALSAVVTSAVLHHERAGPPRGAAGRDRRGGRGTGPRLPPGLDAASDRGRSGGRPSWPASPSRRSDPPGGPVVDITAGSRWRSSGDGTQSAAGVSRPRAGPAGVHRGEPRDRRRLPGTRRSTCSP